MTVVISALLAEVFCENPVFHLRKEALGSVSAV